MIVVLKKKTLFLICAIIIAVLVVGLCVGVGVKRTEAVGITKRVIVIDAGHGGADNGVIGKNGTKESEKNLEIANLLQRCLTDAGFLTIMTRTTGGGADEPVSGFKNDDFSNRKQTIEKSAPDLVISIHCNKFPSSARRGAQTFYNKVSEGGKAFAESVQRSLNVLNEKIIGKSYSALSGEYFMLNCTENPSVIVECGFLSNTEDEKLLNDESYLNELVEAIYGGVVDFLDKGGNQGTTFSETVE